VRATFLDRAVSLSIYKRRARESDPLQCRNVEQKGARRCVGRGENFCRARCDPRFAPLLVAGSEAGLAGGV
jgi:hypothetical protein